MTLHHGDCLEVMPTFAAESVDAIVTDPPYGLGFMGKHWDHGVPGVDFWREMYRVLKPGGYLLSFAGTRTVHRFGVAIEDAGFEIRDTLMWIYASGFPKSLDVSKALDKVAGAERTEVVGTRGLARWKDGAAAGVSLKDDGGIRQNFDKVNELRAPATDLARKWEGWGTALKPAHEPIVMARKPLIGTVAQNVTRYGTGALNIDGTRIGFASEADRAATEAEMSGPRSRNRVRTDHKLFDIPANGGVSTHQAGRWPSNVLLSDPELFDEPNPGVVGSGATTTSGTRDARVDTLPKGWSGGWAAEQSGRQRDEYDGDSGGYSRFFIIPKADRAERERGLAGAPKDKRRTMGGGLTGVSGDRSGRGGEAKPLEAGAALRANTHPTVKPIDLMRHLVRLVTPPGGTVLDPFAGSGSTLIAAEMEGFAWIGIEREAEYVAIAEGRLNGVQKGLGLR